MNLSFDIWVIIASRATTRRGVFYKATFYSLVQSSRLLSSAVYTCINELNLNFETSIRSLSNMINLTQIQTISYVPDLLLTRLTSLSLYKIRGYADLSALRLTSLRMHHIKHDIILPTTLVDLTVTGNVSQNLSAFTNLRHLSLAASSGLHSYEKLNLHSLKILGGLPETLPALRELDVMYCSRAIHDLPTTLTRLSISNCRNMCSIVGLVALTDLSLGTCNVTETPAGLIRLVSDVKLDVRHLTNLRTLDMRCAEHDGWRSLTTLESLCLNQKFEIPSTFTKLRELQLNHTPDFTCLPNSLRKLQIGSKNTVTEADIQCLTMLDELIITGVNCGVIRAIKSLTALTTLEISCIYNLWDNNAQSYPNDYSMMTNLRQFRTIRCPIGTRFLPHVELIV